MQVSSHIQTRVALSLRNGPGIHRIGSCIGRRTDLDAEGSGQYIAPSGNGAMIPLISLICEYTSIISGCHIHTYLN
jgi:hypothetical protein